MLSATTMRLTLVTSSLSCGGAERAVVLLAEGFLKKGHNVSVVTLTGTGTDFYKLPDKVHRLTLNIAKKSPTLIHALWNNGYRLLVLRQAIRSLQPEVVISFLDQTSILTLLALIKTSYPVIVNEQNNPAIASTDLWKKLRRVTYPHSAMVVSASQGVDYYFDWLPKTKRAVIYNPLVPLHHYSSKNNLIKGADPDKKWVIAMGRLVYQKGFDILLSAFQKIASSHSDWQMLILGEGELRPELEALKESLGLTHQVLFPGLISNPFPVLKSSKLFVLSSRFEGFGNVLIEAMACRLPVISTDCPSGPREIIRHEVDGLLVPNENVKALAAAMERLMSDEAERKRLAARAPEVAERFSLEKIIGIWEELMAEVVKEKS
jgi:glycosyltransferase involved in cell wall biosynthesis